MLADDLVKRYTVKELIEMLRKPLKVVKAPLITKILGQGSYGTVKVGMHSMSLVDLLEDEDVQKQLDYYIKEIRFVTLINSAITKVNRQIVMAIKYITLKQIQETNINIFKPKRDTNVQYRSAVNGFLTENFKNYYVKILQDIDESYAYYTSSSVYRTSYQCETADGLTIKFNIGDINTKCDHKLILNQLRAVITLNEKNPEIETLIRRNFLREGIVIPNIPIEVLVKKYRKELVEVYMNTVDTSVKCCGMDIKLTSHITRCPKCGFKAVMSYSDIKITPFGENNTIRLENILILYI